MSSTQESVGSEGSSGLNGSQLPPSPARKRWQGDSEEEARAGLLAALEADIRRHQTGKLLSDDSAVDLARALLVTGSSAATFFTAVGGPSSLSRGQFMLLRDLVQQLDSDFESNAAYYDAFEAALTPDAAQALYPLSGPAGSLTDAQKRARRRYIERCMSAVRSRNSRLYHERQVSLALAKTTSRRSRRLLRDGLGLPIVSDSTLNQLVTHREYDAQVRAVRAAGALPLNALLSINLDNYQIVSRLTSILMRQFAVYTDCAAKRVVLPDGIDAHVNVANGGALLPNVNAVPAARAVMDELLGLLKARRAGNVLAGVAQIQAVSGFHTLLSRNELISLSSYVEVVERRNPNGKQSTGLVDVFPLFAHKGSPDCDVAIASDLTVMLDALVRLDRLRLEALRPGEEEILRCVVLSVDAGMAGNLARFLRWCAHMLDPNSFAFSDDLAAVALQAEVNVVVAEEDGDDDDDDGAATPSFASSSSSSTAACGGGGGGGAQSVVSTSQYGLRSGTRHDYLTISQRGFDDPTLELGDGEEDGVPTQTSTASSTTRGCARVVFEHAWDVSQELAVAELFYILFAWRWENQAADVLTYLLDKMCAAVADARGPVPPKTKVLVWAEVTKGGTLTNKRASVNQLDADSCKELLRRLGVSSSPPVAELVDKCRVAVWVAVRALHDAFANVHSFFKTLNSNFQVLETRHVVLMVEWWHANSSGLLFFYQGRERFAGMLWWLAKQVRNVTLSATWVGKEKGFTFAFQVGAVITQAWVKVRAATLAKYGARARLGVEAAKKWHTALPKEKKALEKESTPARRAALGRTPADEVNVTLAAMVWTLETGLPVLVLSMDRMAWATAWREVYDAVLDLESVLRTVGSYKYADFIVEFLANWSWLRRSHPALAEAVMWKASSCAGVFLEHFHAFLTSVLPESGGGADGGLGVLANALGLFFVHLDARQFAEETYGDCPPRFGSRPAARAHGAGAVEGGDGAGAGTGGLPTSKMYRAMLGPRFERDCVALKSKLEDMFDDVANNTFGSAEDHDTAFFSVEESWEYRVEMARALDPAATTPHDYDAVFQRTVEDYNFVYPNSLPKRDRYTDEQRGTRGTRTDPSQRWAVEETTAGAAQRSEVIDVIRDFGNGISSFQPRGAGVDLARLP